MLPDSAKLLCKGRIFKFYMWPQPLYDGSMTTFEVITRPDVVTILALTDKQEILVTKERQPHIKGWYYSLPGGRVEEGEDIEGAARRELLEETGYVSDRLEYYKSVMFYRDIRYYTHIFVARSVVKRSAPRLDNGEKIKVKKMSLDEFLKLVFSDQFKYPVITLLFAKALYGSSEYNNLLDFLKGVR